MIKFADLETSEILRIIVPVRVALLMIFVGNGSHELPVAQLSPSLESIASAQSSLHNYAIT